MKCELCHKNDAAVAINTEKGEEGELYVCKECAKRERTKRQKKSQRTRKVTGLPPGVSMSITEVSGEDVPPPIIEALMGAMDGIASEIEKRIGEGDGEGDGEGGDGGGGGGRGVGGEDGEGEETSESPEKLTGPKYHTLPCERAEAQFRVGSRIHLEGLYLLGDLPAVQRAAHALGMHLEGVDADGVHDAGHVYTFKYTGSSEQAKRVVADLLAQERNARIHLFESAPRVFGDSLCRALAILKNCRLLSPAEFFDLLSPLRLAALEKMLDGITYEKIQKLMSAVALDSREDRLDEEERDRICAERADKMNALFEDVVLNERAEEKFL